MQMNCFHKKLKTQFCLLGYCQIWKSVIANKSLSLLFAQICAQFGCNWLHYLIMTIKLFSQQQKIFCGFQRRTESKYPTASFRFQENVFSSAAYFQKCAIFLNSTAILTGKVYIWIPLKCCKKSIEIVFFCFNLEDQWPGKIPKCDRDRNWNRSHLRSTLQVCKIIFLNCKIIYVCLTVVVSFMEKKNTPSLPFVYIACSDDKKEFQGRPHKSFCIKCKKMAIRNPH